MNECKKTQEYITDAVDNRLGGDERSFFDGHIDACPTCRNDFELESITRNFVKTKLTRQTTPADVVQRIKDDIEKQAVAEKPGGKSGGWYSLARAAVLACIVIGAAALLYLFNSSDTRHTVQAADIMDQTIENYGLFLAGTIQPAEVGNSVEELHEYFSSRVDFPVALKPVKECEWVGGILSDYEGLPLAHLVYKIPAGIIYVYQTNWNSVRQGNKISLSNGAITSLNETGWYLNGSHDDFNVVMWLYDKKTLCAAVSPIEKSELQDMFATENPQW